MANGGGIDGLALGSVAAGGLFLFAAIKGKTVLGSVQALIKGQSPSSSASANPIAATGAYVQALGSQSAASTSLGSSGSGSGTAVTGGGSVQAILQQTAAQFGWGSGAEWQALNNIEMHEAGYNTAAKNPSSGAFGIAQSYGHPEFGYPEYGGQGLTQAQVAAANNPSDPGCAAAQALWMCRYIKATYGSPSAAWAQYFNHAGGAGSY